ncbi:hypothetical protein OG218_14355 [Kineococcus sp. NBC_00420]|uniref:hypothetical protein n=1 Tax=Kineococcus sp. NBC_00420 TaxID=2903564 RepID=UPI002E204EEC
MSQTTTLAVIGGAAALASAVLGLVQHHDTAPAQAAPRPVAPVVLHLEHPLYLPALPEQGILGPGDVLGPWNVVPPTGAAPFVVAPHAVIRPL